MKSTLQSGTSDKHNWRQYAFISEKQRKELIEAKLNRAMKFIQAKPAKKK